MADSKVSALTQLKIPNKIDLLYVVDDPSGTPVSKYTTVGDINGGSWCVTDTTIADHAAAGTAGSIAWAIAQASAAGGGSVIVGPGTFTLTSAAITVPAGVSLIGAGRTATLINQTTAAVDGVIITGSNHNAVVRDLKIAMPAGASALTAALKLSNASFMSVFDIACSGGSSSSWGMICDQIYNVNISNVRINDSTSATVSNGLYIYNTFNTNNTGDSNFTGIHIYVRNSAVGLKTVDDPNGTYVSSINDITFTNLQVLGNGGAHTGFDLSDTKRNTFIQCDIENCATATMTLASSCTYNTFINCSSFSSGGITDSSTYGINEFINGFGDFLERNTLVKRVRQTFLELYNNQYLAITNISQANPAVVTYTGTDPENGDIVGIMEVTGMTEVNARLFTVANVNTGANTFELSGVDSSAYTAYSANGVVVNGSSVVLPYTHAGRSLESFTSSGNTYVFLPESAGVAGIFDIDIFNYVAYPIIVVAATGDFLVTTSAGQASTLSSAGAAREHIGFRNPDGKYWYITHIAGTWS